MDGLQHPFVCKGSRWEMTAPMLCSGLNSAPTSCALQALEDSSAGVAQTGAEAQNQEWGKPLVYTSCLSATQRFGYFNPLFRS